MRMPPFCDGISPTTGDTPSGCCLHHYTWRSRTSPVFSVLVAACLKCFLTLPNHFWLWGQEGCQSWGRPAGVPRGLTLLIQETHFVCSSIYNPRFSQKLKPPHVWVTRYWHPVVLWLSQLCGTSVTITHNCSVLLVWQGEQDDRLYEGEEIWNVRVAATRTVMFNHIPQEETFKNGYRPMVNNLI